MKIPCALTIAGSDSGGGAGIQADIKTFAVLGVHGLSVLTALTAQNTRGVLDILEVPAEFVRSQLCAVLSDFEVVWAKTGMLYNREIIATVRREANRHGLKLVVDPVMVSTTGHRLIEEGILDELKRLISISRLVTPNVSEAEALSGMRIRSPEDAERAAREILRIGAEAVLLKGGHLRGRRIVDIFARGRRVERLEEERLPVDRLHGTGCTLSAAVTAELAKGKSLPEAVKLARHFVHSAIEHSLEVGGGARPVNQMARLWMEAERGRLIEEVWIAAKLLESCKEFADLIPEVGTNIAAVLPGARRSDQTIGLSGRIVRVAGRPFVTGFPQAGGSEHVANFVLTAHRLDPRMRAGMNIRFSEEVLVACKKLGLSVGSFNREREPPGVKTMVWGIEEVHRKVGKVPDVVFDRGGVGKEPMVRLLGGSPLEVAQLAIKIARMIKG
jgi:hydroxymethylpyrimidine/phosphomethylpyrimidine kinase